MGVKLEPRHICPQTLVTVLRWENEADRSYCGESLMVEAVSHPFVRARYLRRDLELLLDLRRAHLTIQPVNMLRDSERDTMREHYPTLWGQLAIAQGEECTE